MDCSGRRRRLESCRLHETGLLVLASMFVLCFAPAPLRAQTTHTVSATQVEVHKAPSTSSAVIGRVVRGRSIEVTREVGDWVQVVWPAAPDRIGYVRVRFGATPIASLSEPRSGSLAASSAASAATPPTEGRVERRDTASVTTPAALPQSRIVPLPNNGYQLPVHTLGFGARMDPFRAIGGTGRFWSDYGFGVQIDLSRSSVSSELSPGRLTTFYLSPSVLYPLPGIVNSSVWLRPYVGSGIDVARSSLRNVTPGMSMNHTSLGFKAFGGAELTFAGAPQASVSVDFGYHWLDSPFPGFDVSGVRASFAGHWYIK